MAVTINASTSNGLQISSDTSGEFQFQDDGTTNLTIKNDGSVGIGTASPSVKLHVYTGSATTTYAYVGNTAGTGLYGCDGAGTAYAYSSGSGAMLVGTSGVANLLFYINAAERARIDTSGNLLVTTAAGLGYGSGAGGTVTQATSKTTAVTLNKPTGQITMNNAALASLAEVAFTVNNTLVGTSDTVVVYPSGSFNYTAVSQGVGSGSFSIRIKNISAGSLSEALLINFAVIKGATA